MTFTYNYFKVSLQQIHVKEPFYDPKCMRLTRFKPVVALEEPQFETVQSPKDKKVTEAFEILLLDEAEDIRRRVRRDQERKKRDKIVVQAKERAGMRTVDGPLKFNSTSIAHNDASSSENRWKRRRFFSTAPSTAAKPRSKSETVRSTSAPSLLNLHVSDSFPADPHNKYSQSCDLLPADELVPSGNEIVDSFKNTFTNGEVKGDPNLSINDALTVGQTTYLDLVRKTFHLSLIFTCKFWLRTVFFFFFFAILPAKNSS